MKTPSSQTKLYLAALALLVVTNIVVLSGAMLNRSGEAEATVELTERELSFPYRVRKENSGLSLSLNWRVLPKSDAHSSSSNPDWLDQEKLSELGFNIDDYKDEKYDNKRPLPIEAFIVLENDGLAYQESLKRAQDDYKRVNEKYLLSQDDEDRKKELDNAQKKIDREQTSKSRLFAIDAGVDPVQLRKKYSKTYQYIIAKGTVRLGYRYTADNREDITGYVSSLSVKRINVPLQQREIFSDLAPRKKNRYKNYPPRYSVQVAYGSRYEPWIESVKLLQ